MMTEYRVIAYNPYADYLNDIILTRLEKYKISAEGCNSLFLITSEERITDDALNFCFESWTRI